MKVKYIAASHEDLPTGAVREVLSIEGGFYRIMTEPDETHLFPPELFDVIDESSTMDMVKYVGLLDRQVTVICKDGIKVTGVWIDWTSEQDNEPDPESITLSCADSSLIEFYVCEIREIGASP